MIELNSDLVTSTTVLMLELKSIENAVRSFLNVAQTFVQPIGLSVLQADVVLRGRRRKRQAC